MLLGPNIIDTRGRSGEAEASISSPDVLIIKSDNVVIEANYSDLITIFDCQYREIHIENGVFNLICLHKRIKSESQSCGYLSEIYLL